MAGQNKSCNNIEQSDKRLQLNSDQLCIEEEVKEEEKEEDDNSPKL